MTSAPVATPQKKRHRPLAFALGLCGVCALVLAVPLVGPRLMAGGRWDEPDAKPVWSVRDRVRPIFLDLNWTRDGRRVAYVLRPCARSEQPAAIERAREDGRVLASTSLAPDPAEPWSVGVGMHLPPRFEAGNKTMSELYTLRWRDSPERAAATAVAKARIRAGNRQAWGDFRDRLFTRHIEVRRRTDGGLARSFAMRESGLLGSPNAFFSRDGSHVVAIAGVGVPRGHKRNPQSDPLETVPNVECRVWNVASGRLARSRVFPRILVRWGQSGGEAFDPNYGLSSHAYSVDGNAVWVPCARWTLPDLRALDEAQQRQLNRRDGQSFDSWRRQIERDAWGLRAAGTASNDLALVDLLSGRAVVIPAREPLRWAETGLSWSDWTTSRDGRLAVTVMNGANESVATVVREPDAAASRAAREKAEFGALHAWDLRARRLLWTAPREESLSFSRLALSPDASLLAVAMVDSRPRPSHPVRVYEARTGRVLAEWSAETPRQRFERAGTGAARPAAGFLDTLARGARRLAGATPAPPSRGSDEGSYVTSLRWSPDGRALAVARLGGEIALWPAPAASTSTSR